jgi:hypothetical protein
VSEATAAHRTEERRGRPFAQLLDFYQTSGTTSRARSTSAGPDGTCARFTPDFTPQYDSTRDHDAQPEVRRRRTAKRGARELYPGVNCKIFYQRDYLSLVSKYGLEDVSG